MGTATKHTTGSGYVNPKKNDSYVPDKVTDSYADEQALGSQPKEEVQPKEKLVHKDTTQNYDQVDENDLKINLTCDRNWIQLYACVITRTSEGLAEFMLKAGDRKTKEATEKFGNIKFEGNVQKMTLV